MDTRLPSPKVVPPHFKSRVLYDSYDALRIVTRAAVNCKNPALRAIPQPKREYINTFETQASSHMHASHLRSAVVGIQVVGSSRYIPREYLGVADDQFSSVRTDV